MPAAISSPAGQHDARGAILAHADARHRRAGTDLDPGGTRRPCQRRGQRAEPAARLLQHLGAARGRGRYRSDITVPGERGPRLLPSTASSASAPLSSGRSKCSSSRSCTHMAPMRSSSRMSLRPSRRTPSPSPRSVARSRQLALPSRGGVALNTGCSAPARALQLRLPGGIAVGVGLRARAQAAQVAWSECQMPPVGVQCRGRHVIARQRQAVTRQVELRRNAAGIRCSRWAQADTEKPGANSRVTAAPPSCSAASSTSTERPPRAR